MDPIKTPGDGQNTDTATQEAKPQRDDEKYVGGLRAFKKATADYRTKQEVLWYEIQLLKDGDHYQVVNASGATSVAGTIKITPIRKRRGEIMRTINKFRSLVRSIKAFTMSTELRWEVVGDSDEAKTASNYLNWYSQSQSKFQEVIREVLEYGLLRSVGYFDVYWDNDQKLPVVASRDPFDLYWDRNGQGVIRTYRKPVKDIRTEKDASGDFAFKIDGKEIPKETIIPSTNKQSSSDIQQNYLSAKYTVATSSNSELAEAMMEEYHMLERGEDGVQKVKIVTLIADSNKVFREEDQGEDTDFRFVPYWPEKRPNDIYNEPWMKDAIDPQRTIDNTFTHFEEFMRVMAKGRILKHKDTKMDRVSDRDGQIVEWEGAKPPENWMPQSIGGDKFNLYGLAEKTMEDLVGIHPSEVRKTNTAKGIGYLMASDEQNISEPFENLKIALVEVACRILKLSVKHTQASQDIFWWESGEMKNGKVIGEGADNKPDEAKLLKAFDQIRVELIPKGPFAALTREDKLMSLVKLGIIKNPQNIIEGLNIGNVREFLQREIDWRQQFPGETPPVNPDGTPAPDQAQPVEPNPNDMVTPRQDIHSIVSDVSAMIDGNVQ